MSGFDDFKRYIKGKKIAVVGIGVSNIPLIRFLVKLEAHVTAFDKKESFQLGDLYDEFLNSGVELSLGKEYLKNLRGFDVVFKTPGMRVDCVELLDAKKNGAYITSEIEEFIRYCRADIIAVTGSDGKTTTTSIISELLKAQGYKVWTGGNIGTPLFSCIEDVMEGDKVVLELSSFQLMTMKLPINIAVVTNVTPNHLDIHKDMDEYIRAKENVFKYQNDNGLLILNKDNDITNGFAVHAKGIVRYFGMSDDENYAKVVNNNIIINDEFVCKVEDVLLKGKHNLENYLAAFSATKDLVELDTMRKIAMNFSGVEHRCEFVKKVDGVEFYNDSIASTPTRTLAGLKTFGKKVILIAGGYDKKIELDSLAAEGYKYIKELIVMGDTKEKIIDIFESIMKKESIYIPISKAFSMEEAVYLAKKNAVIGDIVVLSPACASFDMYRNFEERGRVYKEFVNRL